MYTVGIKRRFWFGYRKVMVTGHDWQNGRFILNLVDRSQEHIPGFAVPILKVYNDFWTHIAQIEQERKIAAFEAYKERQGATKEPPRVAVSAVEIAQEDVDVPRQEVDLRKQEIERRAAERVRSILASDGAASGYQPQ